MCLAAKKIEKHETSNVVTHSIKTFKMVHILENLKNKSVFKGVASEGTLSYPDQMAWDKPLSLSTPQNPLS